MGSKPDAIERYLSDLDAEVCDLIKEPEMSGAITEIANQLWDDLSHMSGDHVRHIIALVACEVEAPQAGAPDDA